MDRDLMRATMAVDDDHWWYRGRRRIIRAELDRLPLARPAQILDAGCGSGRTLEELVDYGAVRGLELDPDAAEMARGRGLGEVVVGRLEELPWADDSFDLITCLDVIEHTPRDDLALTELRRVARPGAFMLVTVPAYPALWSRHDVANHHYRRYTRRALLEACTASGWGVARISSFNSLLLAPAAVVRLAQRHQTDTNGSRHDVEVGPPWLNRVLEQPLRAEARWLGGGRRLPAGLSLIAILRKPWTGP